MSKLRLSLTMPGAVSLGSYEGGALAALLVAIQHLGEDKVVVDSIGGASAGSITAVLTSQVLLRGKDPVAVLADAWVSSASFKNMRTHSTDSPLSSTALNDIATEVMTEKRHPNGPAGSGQSEAIQLSLSLTSLAGMNYTITGLPYQGSPPVTIGASTYQDWYDVEVDATTTDADFLKHANAGIASGSNAMGFPPKQLDRSSSKKEYLAAGITNFPANGLLWYTDGGTTDNEPIGRTIDLTQRIDSGEDDRLFLLIHYDTGPHPDPASSPWVSANQPPWVRTAIRALSVSRAQSIVDDLKRLQKMNTRLEWTEKIGPALKAGIDQAVDGLDAAAAAKVRAAVTESLSGALAEIRGDQATLGSGHAKQPAEAASLEELTQTLVQAASGLEGRQHITFDLVSPAVDGPRPNQLAGSFLGHFGGFFDVVYRQSDFALGYRNMQTWLKTSFGSYLHLQDPADLETALTAVQSAYDALGWDTVRDAGATLDKMPWRDKIQLAALGEELAHVILHDVTHHGT
jgi:predicted acylesterase/phospholipase RssA